MTTTPALEAQGLFKVFGKNPQSAVKRLRAGQSRADVADAGTAAVIDASFAVAPGEIFVIMGLSGSGKSTIIRMLNGLYEATAGSVTVRGESVTDTTPAKLRELRRDGIDDLSIAKLPYWEYASEATLDKAFPDGFPGWPLEHAGVMETSMMLHLHPEVVNMDKVPMHPPADFPLHDMYPYDPATVPASGALSSAAVATAEKGKMFMDEYVEGAAAALDEAFVEPEKIIILGDCS